MKNFHSKVVETVVHAITEFYNILDEAKENKKAISDTYNKEYGAMKLKEINALLEEKRKETVETVNKALEEFQVLIDNQRKNALNGSTVTDDYKFFTLPVELTKDELSELCNKNKNDYLFVRACKKYAEEHNVQSFAPIDTLSIKNDAIKMLKEILPQYTQENIISDNEVFSRNKEHFEAMAEKGVLNTIDNSIS